MLTKVRAGATERWKRARARSKALDHVVVAWQHYTRNDGNFLAAALTYYSFLALFPLIFVAVAVGGYVLAFHPSLLTDFEHAIERNVPGDFGVTLKKLVEFAVNNKTRVGLIGIAGFAWSGLGWIANLRTAVDRVWGVPKAKHNFFKGKLLDAGVLAGLGLGIVLSLGLTAGGTALGGQLLDWANLSDASESMWLIKVVGIGLAIAGDMLVFTWVLIRLPQVRPSRRTTVRTALLAASGFEVLKLVGTWYGTLLARSPAVAALGAVVGVLIFMYLVSRFLLFCTAWAATAEPGAEVWVAVPEQDAGEVSEEFAPVGARPTVKEPTAEPVGKHAQQPDGGGASSAPSHR